MECIKTLDKTNTMVLSPTNSAQQYGLEPANIPFNTYHQPNSNPGTPLQLVGENDIDHTYLPNNEVSGVHFNGHQGTLGIIELLFPFHGFT